MFAQANSEHCRHKIFNATWTVDGEAQGASLFQMIRNTHVMNPRGTVVAYSDNSAVMEGAEIERFFPDASGEWRYHRDLTHILMKVETHNHPTAIAPHPGAGTGAGGEIRDEGATARRQQAGLPGFSVSNLNIPGARQPRESDTAQARASPSRSHRWAIGAAYRRSSTPRRGVFPHLRDGRGGEVRGLQADHARGRIQQTSHGTHGDRSERTGLHPGRPGLSSAGRKRRLLDGVGPERGPSTSTRCSVPA